jgi:hypothetical protein
LIDADKLEEYVLQEMTFFDNADEDVMYNAIQGQPTVDAAPVVHGEWVEYKPKKDGCVVFPTRSYYCSECGKNSAFIVNGMESMPTKAFGRLIYNYCPHCGAKMCEDEP